MAAEFCGDLKKGAAATDQEQTQCKIGAESKNIIFLKRSESLCIALSAAEGINIYSPVSPVLKRELMPGTTPPKSCKKLHFVTRYDHFITSNHTRSHLSGIILMQL